MADISVDQVFETIGQMSIVDLIAMTKKLEDQWGVKAEPSQAFLHPVPVPVDVVEEKTEFNVLLAEVGPNKMNVIKAVREITALGLKEAKELVENAPKMVREAVSKEDAEETKQKLEAAGAKVELK